METEIPFLDRSLNEILWKDVKEDSDYTKVKPVLAHYTSATVLESILRTGQIWLSHPLLMNDLEELRFGVLEALRILPQCAELNEALKSQDLASQFHAAVDEFFQAFDENEAFDVYIICLCRHLDTDRHGKLAMWRGYGADGHGIAIEFDTSGVKAPGGGPLVLAPVFYGSKEERLGWINGITAQFCAELGKHSLSANDVRRAAYYWFERIKMFALYSKDIGFKDEAEWRAVYLPSRDKESIFKKYLGYNLGPRGVEPKLKLPIDELASPHGEKIELEDLISGIVIGPSAASPIALRTIKRMCAANGRTRLAERVRPSEIPYRPR